MYHTRGAPPPSPLEASPYSARLGHVKPTTADVPDGRAGATHSMAPPPGIGLDVNGANEPTRQLGDGPTLPLPPLPPPPPPLPAPPMPALLPLSPSTSTSVPVDESGVEAPWDTTVTTIAAPPSSGDVCSKEPATATPPRSAASPTEEALMRSGAVAMYSMTDLAAAAAATAAAARKLDSAVAVAMAVAGEEEADGELAIIVETSHSTSAELTQHPSAAVT